MPFKEDTAGIYRKRTVLFGGQSFIKTIKIITIQNLNRGDRCHGCHGHHDRVYYRLIYVSHQPCVRFCVQYNGYGIFHHDYRELQPGHDGLGMKHICVCKHRS
jgi:hypothetical protein